MQGKRAIKKSLNLQFDGRFIGKLAFYQFTLILKFRRLVQVGQFSYFQPWEGKVKSCKKQQNSAHKKLKGLGRGTVYDRRRYSRVYALTQKKNFPVTFLFHDRKLWGNHKNLPRKVFFSRLRTGNFFRYRKSFRCHVHENLRYKLIFFQEAPLSVRTMIP